MKFDIKVGTSAYLEPWGSVARRTSKRLIPVVVVKVGQNFFYVAHSLDAPALSWKKISKNSFIMIDEDWNGGYIVRLDAESFERKC